MKDVKEGKKPLAEAMVDKAQAGLENFYDDSIFIDLITQGYAKEIAYIVQGLLRYFQQVKEENKRLTAFDISKDVNIIKDTPKQDSKNNPKDSIDQDINFNEGKPIRFLMNQIDKLYAQKYQMNPSTGLEEAPVFNHENMDFERPEYRQTLQQTDLSARYDYESGAIPLSDSVVQTHNDSTNACNTNKD